MRRRLIWFSLGIVGATLMVLIVVASIAMRASVRYHTAENFAKLSEELYYNLERMHLTAMQSVQLLAESPLLAEMLDDTEALRYELLRFRRIMPFYEDISIVDASGVVRASTDFAPRGDWRLKPHFQKALSGSPAVSPVHLITEPLKTVVQYTAPISAGGRVVAVVAATMNIREFENIVFHLTFGSTGHAFVLDEQGTILVHADRSLLFERVPKVLGAERSPEGFSFELRGRSWFGNRFVPSGASSPSLSGVEVPRWIPVVAQETGEIYLPFWRAIAVLLVSLVFLFVAARRAAVILGERLVRPLNILAAAADRVAQGELDITVPAEGDDEVARLAATFNRMLAALAESKRLLEANERRYREMADLMPQTLFETDAAGFLTYLNRTGYQTLGYQPGEVLGRLRFIDVVAPEDRERVLRNAVRVMGGEPGGGNEYRIVRKDGTVIPAYLYSIPRFENERIAGIRGIGVDITEMKRSEEELRRREMLLIQAQKVEAVGALAGGLAHDFNNVLGGIGGTVSIISYLLEHEDVEKVPPQLILGHLGSIQRQVRRAGDMIRQLLALSRRQEISFVPMDLAQVVREVADICERTLDKSVRLEIAPLPERAVVNGDASLVEQALLNLMVNAWHAMTIMRRPGDRQGGTCSLSLERMSVTADYPDWPGDLPLGDYWAIRVGDTGVGIRESEMSRIFDPFYTTKATSAGSGLGLPMSYTIARQHRGHIAVFSREGQGSVFTLFLPASVEEPAPSVEPATAKVPSCAGTVLLAADDGAVRELAATMLGLMGYTVIAATDGEEAMRLFAEHRGAIDLAVLDLLMPGMSGVEVLEAIRREAPSMPALIISGYRYDDRLAGIESLPAAAVLQKPFTLEQFIEALMRLVGGNKGKGASGG